MNIRFSLYYQIAVLFVAVSVVAITISGWLSYHESRRVILSQAAAAVDNVAAAIGAGLNQRARDAREAMQRLAANETLCTGDSESIQKFLAAALFSSSMFNNIYYFSPQGPLVAVAYADNRDLGQYAGENYLKYGENPATANLYQDLLKARDQGSLVFSRFFKSDSGRLMSSFILPVQAGGKLKGILSCGMVLDQTSRLGKSMEAMKPAPEACIALLDHQGRVLVQTGTIPPECIDAENLFLADSMRAAGYLFSMHLVQDAGLEVCVGMPETSVTGLLNHLRNRIIFYMLLIAFLAVISGLRVAGVLIKPLQLLIAGLRQLRQGRAVDRIEHRASGEAGEALEAFNELNDKIRKDAMLNRTWTDLWNG